jgi:excisionase family DNA binding protein
MKQKLSFENLPSAVSQLNRKLDNIERLLERQEQQSTETPEQLLTVQEAARFLNLTVPTIYSKVSKGELPVMKRSKRLYFSSIQLMEYIKDGSKKSNAEIEAGAEAYLSNSKKKGYYGK